MPGHRQEILYLRLPVSGPDQAHGGPGTPDGAHGFRMPVPVCRDKAAGQGDNLRRRAVILLHQQNFCPGVIPLKADQRLRIRGAKTVDALVLVAHHEKIALVPGKKPDDRMLNAGGVLGLVHAEIGIPLPVMRQDLRITFQNFQGVNQLIVVIHPPQADQLRTVRPVNLRKLFHIGFHPVQFLIFQTHIFHIGDGGAYFPNDAVHGRFSRVSPIEFRDDAHGLLLLQMAEHFRLPVAPAVEYHDLPRQGVDGAERSLPCQGFAEERFTAPAHIPLPGFRIGHGEDAPGIDPLHLRHVPQPRNEDRGLAAARHGQEQHRPLPGPHRLLLLRIQTAHICFRKLLFRHLSLLPRFLWNITSLILS